MESEFDSKKEDTRLTVMFVEPPGFGMSFWLVDYLRTKYELEEDTKKTG